MKVRVNNSPIQDYDHPDEAKIWWSLCSAQKLLLQNAGNAFSEA